MTILIITLVVFFSCLVVVVAAIVVYYRRRRRRHRTTGVAAAADSFVRYSDMMAGRRTNDIWTSEHRRKIGGNVRFVPQFNNNTDHGDLR